MGGMPVLLSLPMVHAPTGLRLHALRRHGDIVDGAHAIELLFQIQVQRAPEEHVDHLHATADAQQRIIELVRIAEQQVLHFLALGRQFRKLAIGDVATIAHGTDILTTRQHEPIDTRQQRFVHADIAGKRDDQRRPARSNDSLRIVVVHTKNALVGVIRRHDADDRPRCTHRFRGNLLNANRALHAFHSAPYKVPKMRSPASPKPGRIYA